MSTIVQGPLSASSSSNPADISRAFTVNVTVGNTLLVAVNLGQSAGIPPSISCGDSLLNTYTARKVGARPAEPASPRDTQWYFFTAPVTVGGACTVTASAGTTRAEIIVWELNGCDNANLVEAEADNTGTGTDQNAGTLVTAGGAFLLGVLQGNGNYTTYTPGAGWTTVPGSPIYLRRQVQTRIVSGAGNYPVNATANAAVPWGGMGIALRDGAPVPTLSGAATLDGPTAAGGLTSVAPSTLSGAATLDGPAAAGTLGPVPGTLTSGWLQLNNGFAHTSAPFDALVSNVVTGDRILRRAGLTSSADPTRPTCSFSDPALPAPGTQVRVTWRRTDTGAEGTELLIVG